MMQVALPQGEVSPDWPSYNCGHAAAILGGYLFTFISLGLLCDTLE